MLDVYSKKIAKLFEIPSMNRYKARKLLSAVADNEVSEIEKAAFLQFIQTHADIRREYEEELRIKHLLSKSLPKYKAPARLRESILRMIDRMEE